MPTNSKIKYEVPSTCPIDTSLQMVNFLWFRRFVPHSIMEKDSLLIETLNNVRKCNFAKARHDLLIRRSLQFKVEKRGNTERWNCWGDAMDYKPLPELFQSPGKMQLIWGTVPRWERITIFTTSFKRNQKIEE